LAASNRNDARTRLGEELGYGPADAAAGAGNHRRLPRQIEQLLSSSGADDAAFAFEVITA
jgi:hypothetical protein